MVEKAFRKADGGVVRTVSYRYDAQGRLEREQDVDSAGKPTDANFHRLYAYPDSSADAKPSRIDDTSWGNWRQSEVFTYDSQGRVVREDLHRGRPGDKSATAANLFQTTAYVYRSK